MVAAVRANCNLSASLEKQDSNAIISTWNKIVDVIKSVVEKLALLYRGDSDAAALVGGSRCPPRSSRSDRTYYGLWNGIRKS